WTGCASSRPTCSACPSAGRSWPRRRRWAPPTWPAWPKGCGRRRRSWPATGCWRPSSAPGWTAGTPTAARTPGAGPWSGCAASAPESLPVADGGVLAGVLLAGELLDVGHDRVGHGAEGPLPLRAVGLGAEVDGRADPDRDRLERPDHLGADRLGPVGAGESDGDDRRAGPGGQHGHAGVTPVEAPVLRTGALGVDAEQLPGLEGPGGGVEGPLPVGPLAPPQRDVAVGLEEPGHLPVVEVLGLGDVADPAGEDQGQEERVAEGDVVGGQDGRPLPGDVLPPLHPDPEEDPEIGGQQNFGQPVAHVTSEYGVRPA